METDFLDDNRRPGAVLGPKTVPKRTQELCSSLLYEGWSENEVESLLTKVHSEWPESLYGLWWNLIFGININTHPVVKITTDKTKKLNSPNGNSTPADSTPILHKGPFIGRNSITSKIPNLCLRIMPHREGIYFWISSSDRIRLEMPYSRPM